MSIFALQATQLAASAPCHCTAVTGGQDFAPPKYPAYPYARPTKTLGAQSRRKLRHEPICSQSMLTD